MEADSVLIPPSGAPSRRVDLEGATDEALGERGDDPGSDWTGGGTVRARSRRDKPSDGEHPPFGRVAAPVQPVVSVVLGTRNRRRFLKATIGSIRQHCSGLPHEIIVVDGGSSDGSLKWLARQKDVITIIQHNGGEWRGSELPRRSWGYFMNLGFHCASGDYVCMVSDDCVLVPGAIEKGVSHLEGLRSRGVNVGAGAFYWRNWPDEPEYHVQLTLGGRMMVNHGLYLREALAEVGWIEEERYAFYHADSDLCMKLWQRCYEVVDCPDSYVEHYSHADREPRSSRSAVTTADWRGYLDKWTGVMFDSGHDSIGSRVAKTHDDPSRSVRAFPRTDITRRRLEQTVRSSARFARRVVHKVLGVSTQDVRDP
jgi:glycosyltransferase involved in cell wall biosynthesis